MECTIKWQGNQTMEFVAETGSGHQFKMDGPPESGGTNSGPRPMEVVLSGAGACSAFDVVLILKKSRVNITDCQVKLTADRADSDPKVFTKIHFHYVIYGNNVKPELVARAIELSKEKYCSASVMLGKTATITSDFEIIETDI